MCILVDLESAGWVSGPLNSERARQSAADRPLNDGEFNESDIVSPLMSG
jgi:hypothetical protein